MFDACTSMSSSALLLFALLLPLFFVFEIFCSIENANASLTISLNRLLNDAVFSHYLIQFQSLNIAGIFFFIISSVHRIKFIVYYLNIWMNYIVQLSITTCVFFCFVFLFFFYRLPLQFIPLRSSKFQLVCGEMGPEKNTT